MNENGSWNGLVAGLICIFREVEEGCSFSFWLKQSLLLLRIFSIGDSNSIDRWRRRWDFMLALTWVQSWRPLISETKYCSTSRYQIRRCCMHGACKLIYPNSLRSSLFISCQAFIIRFPHMNVQLRKRLNLALVSLYMEFFLLIINLLF